MYYQKYNYSLFINVHVFFVVEPELQEEEFDEEATITYYYRCGFECKEIITMLSKRHNHVISIKT